MRYAPMVRSLLENDLYKFSMGQAILHQFPGYRMGWTFKCRNKNVVFRPEMVQEIKEQVKHYCSLRFKEEELDYLRSILWIKNDFVDFLRMWHPRYEDFVITTNADCGLSIEYYGNWFNNSPYEVPVLSIVSEVYNRMAHEYGSLYVDFKERLDEKYNKLRNNDYYLGAFSAFGLRRRLSAEADDLMVEKFSHLNDTMHCITRFVGTSNVYQAWKYGIPQTGTMAHEWIMGVGQGDHKINPAYSNWYMMHAWMKEYGTLNGIALTDTITTDCFLKDFQLTFAKSFDGVRHDSGDPFVWGEKMITQYQKLGLDPLTKTLLFSDSLNFKKADEIGRYFRSKAKVAFGIGTYLSNDTMVEPLNIVLKPTKCNGWDVAKLSDADGKGMCKNPEYVDYLKRCINWRMSHE